jgi:hypothetical protein
MTARWRRHLLLTTVLALTASLAVTVPATAKREASQPKGYAFDTCDAPRQRVMNAWRRSSHFSAVGIYIAGANRACSRQPHLNRTWVRTQRAKGWRLLPIVVGRQAACSPRGWYRGKRISAKVAGDYAKAKRQGSAAARAAVRTAQRLGLPRRQVLWFDLEAFDTGRTHCRRSALRFVSAWTKTLHRHRYRSGLYSSAATLVAFDRARRLGVGRAPDRIWFAHWNGKATAATRYLSRHGWKLRRVHQYRGPHRERHGGARLHIDSNYFALGKHVPGPRLRCGVRIGFKDYRRLDRGDRGRQVHAARCLLGQRPKAGPRGRPSRAAMKRFTAPYNTPLGRAVRSLQRQHPALRATGVLGTRTWVAMLSRGSRPVLKYGASGPAVRRAQRALNAASVRSVPVDGVFGKTDIRLTRSYQRRVGIRPTGVVNVRTWNALQRARVGRR